MLKHGCFEGAFEVREFAENSALRRTAASMPAATQKRKRDASPSASERDSDLDDAAGGPEHADSDGDVKMADHGAPASHGGKKKGLSVHEMRNIKQNAQLYNSNTLHFQVSYFPESRSSCSPIPADRLAASQCRAQGLACSAGRKAHALATRAPRIARRCVSLPPAGGSSRARKTRCLRAVPTPTAHRGHQLEGRVFQAQRHRRRR